MLCLTCLPASSFVPELSHTAEHDFLPGSYFITFLYVIRLFNLDVFNLT